MLAWAIASWFWVLLPGFWALAGSREQRLVAQVLFSSPDCFCCDAFCGPRTHTGPCMKIKALPWL